MARTKKSAGDSTEQKRPEKKQAEVKFELPKVAQTSGNLAVRVAELEAVVKNQDARISELEKAIAYRKPVTSADILGLNQK